MKLFVYASAFLLYLSAFLLASPEEIVEGMKKIIVSKDALITDYFKLAGHGAAFFNAALVLTLAIIMVNIARLPFTGITTAALAIDVCFGFWGKNPVNILPIFLGVMIYAKSHKASLGRYLYTALFGACLGPMVTELMYKLPFPLEMKLLITSVLGIIIGVMLPPLSSHTVSMHMGYNLFGVAAGVAAGFLHAAIVMYTSQMYGGLNLYNNGFSCGWVAIIMIPLIESFMARFEYKKGKGKYRK